MLNNLIGIFMLTLLTGCTISFQLIDTHGTATDLVDDTQSNQPNISPTLTVPVK